MIVAQKLKEKKILIEEMYENLRLMSNNVLTIIKYYADFLGEVIKDYESESKFKKIIKDAI